MSDPPAKPDPPKRAVWFRYTDASSLGIEMAVAVTMGALSGYYVERYLTHWSPWTMLIGFALGVFAAIQAVIRTAKNYQASLRRQAEAEAEAATRDPGSGDPK